MDLLGLISAIWRRKFLALLMIALATLAAVATAYKLPSMEQRSIAVGAATSQILVDSDPSTLVAGAGTDQIAALGSRARVYAQYLSSRDAVSKIAKDTNIPAYLITARGPFSQGTGIKNYEQQPAESRAKDLVDEGKSYRLVFEAQEDVPIITVYATGPSAAAALNLAKSSYKTLTKYVADLQRQGDIAKQEQQKAAAEDKDAEKDADPSANAAPNISVVVRELGAPEGGTVGGKADLAMMVLAFMAVLGLQAFLAAAIIRVQQQRRLAAQLDNMTEPAPPIRAEAPAERFDGGDDAARAAWSRAEYLRR